MLKAVFLVTTMSPRKMATGFIELQLPIPLLVMWSSTSSIKTWMEEVEVETRHRRSSMPIRKRLQQTREIALIKDSKLQALNILCEIKSH